MKCKKCKKELRFGMEKIEGICQACHVAELGPPLVRQNGVWVPATEVESKKETTQTESKKVESKKADSETERWFAEMEQIENRENEDEE